MTDRNRSWNYYERENYNTFQDHRSRRNYKYRYRDKYERGFYNTFQDHGNRKNSKDCYEDKYRNENFYDSDKSYDMDSSYSRDRAYNRNRSYNRDRESSWEYKRDKVEIGPIAGIDHKNTMTKNKLCRRGRSPEYYKNNHEREYFHTFQDHGNRRKYKDHYKDKYRDENFYESDRSYDMDDSHGRDRSYSRDRPYRRDRSWDYCRDVYKEESHKYKRRSRDY